MTCSAPTPTASTTPLRPSGLRYKPNLDPGFPFTPRSKRWTQTRTNSFYFRRIEEQRAIMEKYGDGPKQMWVTEYGGAADMERGYGECKYTPCKSRRL